MKKPKKLPGTLWINRNLWNWRVKLPGSETRQNIPLKRPGTQTGLPATMPRSVAETAARRLWDQAAAGKSIARKQTQKRTIATLAAMYFKHADSYYRHVITKKKTSQARNVRIGLRDLLEKHGSDMPESIEGHHLEALVNIWIGRNYTIRTVNLYLGEIGRFYKWMLSRSMIEPYAEYVIARYPRQKPGRTEARETAPVQPAMMDAVRAVLPTLTPTLRDMLLVQLICSMRPQEVCGMTVESIQPERTGKPGQEPIWLYEPTYTNKVAHHGIPRVIAIMPEVRPIIERRMIGRQPTEHLFRPDESMRESLQQKHAKRRTPLNQGNKPDPSKSLRAGSVWTSEAYGKAIRKASEVVCSELWQEKHGPIPEEGSEQYPAWEAWREHWRITPQQLRHAGATKVRRAAGRKTAAALLGHTEGSKVVDGYTHTAISDEKRRQARRRARKAALRKLESGQTDHDLVNQAIAPASDSTSILA